MIRPTRTAWLLAGTLMLATPTWTQSGPDLLADPTKTLTRVGQAAPQFDIRGLDGQVIRNTSLGGKVAVLVFWTTRCPSCRAENRYTMPMAVDPSRSAYERFATEGIPRIYVLSPEGSILFQSVGYDEADFAALKKVVASALQRLKPPPSAGGRGR